MTDFSQTPNSTLVIIPTLGLRPRTLERAISSVADAGETDLWVVSPIDLSSEKLGEKFRGKIKFIRDSGRGLAAALNQCIEEQEFSTYRNFTWLNDDDLLTKGSLARSQRKFDENPNLSLVFGDCSYRDEHGRHLWTNRHGKLAMKILPWGPDLVPQPSCLFNVSKTVSVGGMSESIGLAFDFDFILRLRQIGKMEYIPQVQSIFTWHPDSLSVKNRWHSVRSAAKARNLAAGRLRPLVTITNPIIAIFTYLAGFALSFKRLGRFDT